MFAERRLETDVLAVNGTVPQGSLTVLFGDVSKQTVSRWCEEWEADGVIVRTVSGRNKNVALAARFPRVASGSE